MRDKIQNREINSSKQIKVGAILSYITIVMNVFLALFYTPWMIAQVGKSDYALYTLSFSLISIFVMDFGIGSSVSRYISKYRAENNEEQISNFLGLIYKMFFVISAIISVFLFVFYFFIGSVYKGLSFDELTKFKFLYIIVSVYSVISLLFIPLDGVLNAYENFIFIKCAGAFQKIFSVMLIIIALSLNLGVLFVLLANVVSGLITILIKVIYLSKNKNCIPKLKYRSHKLFKEVFSFSLWITIISLAQRCMFNLAPSILGIVSNSEEIAIFGLANNLESYYFLLASAINGLFLPSISRLIAENNQDKILNLMIKVGRYQIIVLGLVLSGFLIIGKEFVQLWMGGDFNLAYYAALIIFIPDLLIFSQQIGNTYLIALGKVKYQAFGYILMAVVCLTLSFPLSRFYGCIGSCIAIGAGYLCNFIYINFIYVKIGKLNMKMFYKECYVKPLFVILCFSIFALRLYGFFDINTWTELAISIVSITFLFLIISFVFIISKSERDRILSVFFKRRR